jgi:hypothetical protein
MTHYEELTQLAERLTLAEKASLMEYLSASLKHDLEVEAFKQMPWQQFIDLTYGSLADDPIERGEQPPMEIRDELE